MPSHSEHSELERLYAIILATLNYFLKNFSGSFVCDGFDETAQYYQGQKAVAEKHYRRNKLPKLQHQLARLTEGLQRRADLKYAAYIQEQTGYEIDIFQDLRNRSQEIIRQNKIRNQKELNNVGSMLHYYEQIPSASEIVDKLKTLLAEYSKQNGPYSTTGYSEVINRITEGEKEIVSMRFSTGPKPKHWKETQTISPDGLRKLRITQWSDGDHASTSVIIEFPNANGAIFSVSGIHPDLKAEWKNNSTIVIETKKNYPATLQVREIRSFDDIVSIEYLERNSSKIK